MEDGLSFMILTGILAIVILHIVLPAPLVNTPQLPLLRPKLLFLSFLLSLLFFLLVVDLYIKKGLPLLNSLMSLNTIFFYYFMRALVALATVFDLKNYTPYYLFWVCFPMEQVGNFWN